MKTMKLCCSKWKKRPESINLGKPSPSLTVLNTPMSKLFHTAPYARQNTCTIFSQ